MGNAKSTPFGKFIDNAPLINTSDEVTIIRNLTHNSVISYVLTLTVYHDQLLTFDRIVDSIGKFKCMTNGVKFDILIDDEIHYKNVEDFTLVLVSMQKNTIRIKTYTEEPVVISCVGYSFDYTTRLFIAMNKLKTNTTKYVCGFAKKII